MHEFLHGLPAGVIDLRRRGERLAILEAWGVTVYGLPGLEVEREWVPPASATAVDLDERGRLWAACRDGSVYCEDGTTLAVEGEVVCLAGGERVAYANSRDEVRSSDGHDRHWSQLEFLYWGEDGRLVLWADGSVYRVSPDQIQGHAKNDPEYAALEQERQERDLLRALRRLRRQAVELPAGGPVMLHAQELANFPPLNSLRVVDGVALLGSREEIFFGLDGPGQPVSWGLNRSGGGEGYVYAYSSRHPCGALSPTTELLVWGRDGRLLFRAQNLILPWDLCQPFSSDGSWMIALHTDQDLLVQLRLPSGEVMASVPLSWRVSHCIVSEDGVVYLVTQGGEALSWRPGQKLESHGPGCLLPDAGGFLRWDERGLWQNERLLFKGGWVPFKSGIRFLSDRLVMLTTPRPVLVDLQAGRVVAELEEHSRYAVSADGRWLAALEYRLRLWDLRGPAVVAETRVSTRSELAFAPGHLLVWESQGASVSFLRLPDLSADGDLRPEDCYLAQVCVLGAEVTLTLGLRGQLLRWRNLNAAKELSAEEKDYIVMRARSEPDWAELRDRHGLKTPPLPVQTIRDEPCEPGDLFEVSPLEAARRLGKPQTPFALLRPLAEFPAGTQTRGHLSAQGFSPDGRWWLHHHHGTPRLELLELNTGRRHQLEMSGTHHPSFVFTTDGRLFVANGKLMLWQLGDSPREIPVEQVQDFYMVTASEQGELAACSTTQMARWDPEGRLLGPTSRLREQAWQLRYSPDGQSLAVCYAREIELLGAWQARLPGHRVAFSRDCSLLVTAGNGALELWDCRSRTRLLRSQAANFRVDTLIFLPDHSGALVGQDCGGALRYWRFEDPGQLVPLHVGLRDCQALSADSRLLAVGTGNNRVVLVDVAGWRMIGAAEAGSYGTQRVVFDQQGGLWACSGDLRLFHYELSSHRPLADSRAGLLEWLESRVPRPAPEGLYIGTAGVVEQMVTLDKQNALWDFVAQLVHRRQPP